MIGQITKLERSGDVAGLIDALHHGWWVTRALAASALGGFSGRIVENALLNALRDRSFIVRISAARSLARVKPQLPAETVVSALHPGEEAPTSLSAEEIIKHGLWHLPGIRATETLASALDDASEVDRAIYLHALGETGDRDAVPILIRHLDDAQEGARQSAAHSLGRLRDPVALEALAKHLDDPDKLVRREVVEALAKIGEAARQTLEQAAMSASSRDVRVRAKKALKSL